MKRVLFHVLLANCSSAAVVGAELPPLIKPTAEEYDRAMAAHEASIEAQVKMARDRYSAALAVARRRAEGAKRPADVAAIDAEIAALNAGPLPDAAPPNLPKELAIHRAQCVEAPKRAAKAVAPVQRFTRSNYLEWLAGMEKAAARVKDSALAAAIAGEKERVLASEPKAP